MNNTYKPELLTELAQLQMHALSAGLVEVSWLGHRRGWDAPTIVRGNTVLKGPAYDCAHRVGCLLSLAPADMAMYWPAFHALGIGYNGVNDPRTYHLTKEEDIVALIGNQIEG